MSSTAMKTSGDDRNSDEASESLRFGDESSTAIPKECTDSQYLLQKNTESFRCLAQVLLSSSSLMKNRLFVFPPLENPGIEEAFEAIDLAPTYDNIGVEKYKNLCKEYEIVPLSHIVKSLGTPTMDLKFYGLSKKQMQALMETLKGNVHVETLNLEENFLTTEMVSMLSSMLEENGAVRVLKLRHCQIGENGAGMLNEALSNSQFLSELDLSCNELTDNGVRLMMKGLGETPSLNKLNLARNGLTEDCAEILEKILLENKTLTELDLSWNGFYTGPGNKKLFSGLQKNDRIIRLNMAWNGISTRPAMVPIAKYVRHSETLQFLDLSNNRLAGTSYRAARTSTSKNHSLVEVKIGNNPYNAQEAKDFLSMFSTKTKDPLAHLDMENVYVEKESIPIINRIKAIGKTVVIGGILSNYSIKGPDYKKLLFDRCRYILQKPKKKKAKKDFAHLVLALPDKPIPAQDFETQIKKKKMKKLDKDLLKELTGQFQAKRKRVDCPAMKEVYKGYYPDASLPPEKPKKKKKGRKGKHKRGEEGVADSRQEAVSEAHQEMELQVHDLETPPPDGESRPTATEDGAAEKTMPEENPLEAEEAGDSNLKSESGDDPQNRPDQVLVEHSEVVPRRTVLFSQTVIAYNPEGGTECREEADEAYQETSLEENEKNDEKELRTIELDSAEGKRDLMTSSFDNKEIY